MVGGERGGRIDTTRNSCLFLLAVRRPADFLVRRTHFVSIAPVAGPARPSGFLPAVTVPVATRPFGTTRQKAISANDFRPANSPQPEKSRAKLEQRQMWSRPDRHLQEGT